jgi:hypothetical protein
VTHLVCEYHSQRPIGRVGESAIFAEVTDWVEKMVVGRREKTSDKRASKRRMPFICGDCARRDKNQSLEVINISIELERREKLAIHMDAPNLRCSQF